GHLRAAGQPASEPPGCDDCEGARPRRRSAAGAGAGCRGRLAGSRHQTGDGGVSSARTGASAVLVARADAQLLVKRMSRYQFLVETCRTERLKTLGVWAQIPDERMRFRPEPRARSPLEHMVHQCVSENNWMRDMLGVTSSLPPLPAQETRQAFNEQFGSCSAGRLPEL